jgi:ubiquinone/menaquinone biosynthesis C-methylase UbiE
MSDVLHVRETAEVKRSAFEASNTETTNLQVPVTEISRYLNPPSTTIYPLEYAFNLLGDVRNKLVLEYGCGNGENTLLLAKRGARVKALDISEDLIRIAEKRLKQNNVHGDVEFIVGSAHDLPLPDESVDVVFGMAILHHLDLSLSSREVYRVLRKGGKAIFKEPVRNSRVLSAIRKLIPYQAPDVSPFERPLTDKEIQDYAKPFTKFRVKAFTLPTTNLIDIFPSLSYKYINSSFKLDAYLLAQIPALKHFATCRVFEVIK